MRLPPGKEKLLQVFFREPWTERHLRELARQASVPVQNAYKYLGECYNEGWLVRRMMGPLACFQPNWASDHWLKWCEEMEVREREAFFRSQRGLVETLPTLTTTLVRASAWQLQLILLVGAVTRQLWKKTTPLELVIVSSATTPVELVTAACEQAKAAVAPALVNFTWRSVEEAIAVLRSRHTFYPPAPWHDH